MAYMHVPISIARACKAYLCLGIAQIAWCNAGAQLGYTLYLWAKRINLHQSSGLGLDQCLLMLKRPRPILGILI